MIFRAWISSQNYMAIQGTPDLETLQSFMFHYGNEENIKVTSKIDLLLAEKLCGI